MNKIIYVFVLNCFLSVFLHTQEIKNAEMYIVEVSDNKPDNDLNNIVEISEENYAIINQYGSGNITNVVQKAGSVNKMGNIAEVYQFEQENTANITIAGDGNICSIKQNGNYNNTDIELYGSSNIYESIQEGTGNELLSNVQGKELNYRIEQYGNENFILQMENTNSSISYNIIQSGNGMRLNIVNGSIK